ncbi:hypothetical protein ACQKMD_16675 [Viridibacillus sp. NPDC096237]|uniref:hypothetical protein n=1 Tax=Viridibacillus sp. NPDC096237 TaxID=3390721 RepID=UPI003D013058
MEKWIATTTGTIGFLVSYLVDGVGLAVTILLAVLALDYATGLICTKALCVVIDCSCLFSGKYFVWL